MSPSTFTRWPSVLLVCALMAGGGDGHASTTGTNGRPEADEIEQVMRRNGCMLCHRWAKPWIGPSFRDIAQRYRGAGSAERQALIQRLRSGAVGNHSPVPMSACDASRVSDEELRRVLDHIIDQGALRSDGSTR